MDNYAKLHVEAINCGTVIDHIPARKGFTLLALFHLTETDKPITIGLNLHSAQFKRKDIIKIEDTRLSTDQINQMALYAPLATVNVIENYHVVQKIKPQLPSQIRGVLVCPNSNCISRTEVVRSFFYIRSRGLDVLLRCQYCEKEFAKHNVIDVPYSLS